MNSHSEIGSSFKIIHPTKRRSAMGYVIKQIAAAAVTLVSVMAIMLREDIDNWMFNGLGGWICVVAPLGAIIVSTICLCKDEPKKEAIEKDWMKNFQTTETFFPVYDLSAQRVQREK